MSTVNATSTQTPKEKITLKKKSDTTSNPQNVNNGNNSTTKVDNSKPKTPTDNTSVTDSRKETLNPDLWTSLNGSIRNPEVHNVEYGERQTGFGDSLLTPLENPEVSADSRKQRLGLTANDIFQSLPDTSELTASDEAQILDTIEGLMSSNSIDSLNIDINDITSEAGKFADSLAVQNPS